MSSSPTATNECPESELSGLRAVRDSSRNPPSGGNPSSDLGFSLGDQDACYESSKFEMATWF